MHGSASGILRSPFDCPDRKAYEAAGVPEKFKLIIQENAGQEVKPDARNPAVDWFTKWLAN